MWHLLAEFGDTDLLLALINFCKIHPPKYKKLKNQMHSQSEDAILRLVNMGNDLKQTPLMFAAYHGRDDVIAFLLKQVSRRVKYIELNGINQLHIIIIIICFKGADPWAADRCGRRTALHYACMKGHAMCVHALLENINLEEDPQGGLCR